jgi:hypothetical protein
MEAYKQRASDRKGGGHTAPRIVVNKQGSAVCRDCPKSWFHSQALAAGESHAEATGHRVLATYSAVYQYGELAGAR